MPADEADRLLVARIRAGDQAAWSECIGRFEGRLLAFVDSRLRNRAVSEDVVQETFLGFVIGLPNYNEQTPLESFLFSIAAHKLTDVLRRQGRRPTVPLLFDDSDSDASQPRASARMASSLARSQERRVAEERVLQDAIASLVRQWLDRGEFERLKCIEMLFVMGWANKDVAHKLGISEQTVANHKHYVISRIKEFIARSHLRDTRLEDLGIHE